MFLGVSRPQLGSKLKNGMPMFSVCNGQGHCFVMSVSVTVLELLYFWFLEISQEFEGSGKFQTYFDCACLDQFCST